MMLTCSNYQDFVSATKAVSAGYAVMYQDSLSDGGTFDMLSVSKEGNVYFVARLNSAKAPTDAQFLLDFPSAVAFTGGVGSPTTP